MNFILLGLSGWERGGLMGHGSRTGWVVVAMAFPTSPPRRMRTSQWDKVRGNKITTDAAAIKDSKSVIVLVTGGK